MTTFKLRGKPYKVSVIDIEAAAAVAIPDPIEKYYVKVNGTKFPPKQLVALTLGIPLLNFTTMDANRILEKVGFEVKEQNHALATASTSTIDFGELIVKLAEAHKKGIIDKKEFEFLVERMFK